MRTYQKGEKVRVIKYYHTHMDGRNASNSYMHKRFAGKEVTIHRVIKSGKYFRYQIFEDTRRYKWYPGMFEPMSNTRLISPSRLPDI